MIQVDNGSEFVNDGDRTERESAFEKAAKALNMELKRIRPYSPWQNGKVERSHREDGKILYGRKVFTSEKDLRKQVSKHEARYNKTAKQFLISRAQTKLYRNTSQSVTYVLTTKRTAKKIL